MNKEDLEQVLSEQRAAESKRQSKRALIGVFVVIPGALLLFFVGWILGRLAGLW